MKRIPLGQSSLNVFPLALGTADYGLPRIPNEEALRQMDLYAQLGGNLLDTAEVYSNWVPGEKSRSEKLIGQWLRQSGLKGSMLISTKGGHPLFESMTTPRLSPQELDDDLLRSLDNLGVAHIDLYFLHRDDVNRPVDEFVDYLEEKKQAGLIGAYGLSNWTLGRVQQAAEYAKRRGITGFSVNQIYWSLARVNPPAIGDKTLVPMDEPFYDYHAQTGMAAMAYTSQAKGYLSKRYQGQPIADDLQALYGGPHNEAVLEQLLPWCRAQGCDPAQATLWWFMAQPFAAVPVVSPGNLSQLQILMDAVNADHPPLPEGLPVW